jgi:hypothetical protein
MRWDGMAYWPIMNQQSSSTGTPPPTKSSMPDTAPASPVGFGLGFGEDMHQYCTAIKIRLLFFFSASFSNTCILFMIKYCGLSHIGPRAYCILSPKQQGPTAYKGPDFRVGSAVCVCPQASDDCRHNFEARPFIGCLASLFQGKYAVGLRTDTAQATILYYK